MVRKIFRLMCRLMCLFLLFIIPNYVYADSCSSDEVSRLKALAQNINVTYEYLDADDESLDWGNTIPYGYDYAITVSGMTEEVYFVSKGNENYDFRYSDTNEGTVTYYISNDENGLSIRFYPDSCDSSYALRTIDLSLPIYNEYYGTIECRNIRDKGIDLDICNRTIDKDSQVSESKFYDIVSKYFDDEEENGSFLDNISVWLSNPYVIAGAVVGGGLIVLVVVIAVRRFIKRRRLE